MISERIVWLGDLVHDPAHRISQNLLSPLPASTGVLGLQ